LKHESIKNEQNIETNKRKNSNLTEIYYNKNNINNNSLSIITGSKSRNNSKSPNKTKNINYYNNNYNPHQGNSNLTKNKSKTKSNDNVVNNTHKNIDKSNFNSSNLNTKNDLIPNQSEIKINSISNFDERLSPIKKLSDKNNLFKIPLLNFSKINKDNNNSSKEKFNHIFTIKNSLKKFISFNPKTNNQKNNNNIKKSLTKDSDKLTNNSLIGSNSKFKKINNTSFQNKLLGKNNDSKEKNKVPYFNFGNYL
jgi:hypothetical protein